jgi:hypothetical protein
VNTLVYLVSLAGFLIKAVLLLAIWIEKIKAIKESKKQDTDRERH